MSWTAPAVNLVKLYTVHGSVYVDTLQLSRAKSCVRMYTYSGRMVSEVGRTVKIREAAAFGVHVSNLFASLERANAL
jgi:hypothetical protein